MAEAPHETVKLLSGLIGHMRQIVGDGACYAMLHYGATEEGKRLGAGVPPDALPRVLDRIDSLLLQKTEVLYDDGRLVTLRVRASPLLDGNQRGAHGLVLGLVEGALTASRAGRFKGKVVPGEGEVRLEFVREG